MVPFSLFEADIVNRAFARIGLRARRPLHLIGRATLPVAAHVDSLALLVQITGTGSSGPPGQNFFLDFAAYLQFIVGLPLFVVAERVVSERTRDAAELFAATGVVARTDVTRLSEIHRLVERLRRLPASDIVCLASHTR